jgi:Cu(I)/Ag(I) efflux system membrane fusion protein
LKTIIQHSMVIAGLASLLVVGCGRKTQSGESQSATSQATQVLEYYTCPMHPSVRSDKPGACPICHMSLVKVSATQEHTDSSQARGSVTLSTADQIRANVSTVIVETKTLVKEISAVGKIEQAESSTKQITSRFPGRIERLFVLCCGQLRRVSTTQAGSSET